MEIAPCDLIRFRQQQNRMAATAKTAIPPPTAPKIAAMGEDELLLFETGAVTGAAAGRGVIRGLGVGGLAATVAPSRGLSAPSTEAGSQHG
jgi:hypothetical protein